MSRLLRWEEVRGDKSIGRAEIPGTQYKFKSTDCRDRGRFDAIERALLSLRNSLDGVSGVIVIIKN